MDLGLRGKLAVVTGGGSGIALAAIRLLLDEGAHVVTGDRNIDDLTRLDADALEIDLTEPEVPRSWSPPASSDTDAWTS